MKKFLVLAAAASLSASSALANAGDFYVKGTAGYAKFNNEKLKSGGDFVKLKSKSGGATFGIGAGYYITDIIRADLMLEHFSNIQHKFSGLYSGNAVNLNLKSRSTAAMINGYVDFANVGDIKFFAGLGLGMVKTTGKVNYSVKNLASGRVVLDRTDKVKTKNSMAYAVHLGATTKVVDNVNVDLAYSWRDLGSIKNPKIEKSNFPYRGHHVTLGIRYDI
jgi:opacity protein-like surface antigen